MKVKIKDLKANPYRDMKNYPINPEKIESLKNSINQTGFWDNILARKNNGNVEIAYGHHRLQVLRELYEPEHEVDIPIKEITNSDMLKIMANENDESWGTNPKIIDETVRVTKEFLEEHPEITKELAPTGTSPKNVGYRVISNFLAGNWYESRVRHSLERLKLIDEGIIESEAVQGLPTERAARDFTKAVKQFKPTPTQQKRAAAKIVDMTKGERGEAAVRGVITEEIYRKPKPKHKEFKLIELREEIKETNSLAEKLSPKLLALTRFRDEIGDEVYKNEIKALVININVLMQRLKTFLGGKNVKRIKS